MYINASIGNRIEGFDTWQYYRNIEFSIDRILDVDNIESFDVYRKVSTRDVEATTFR